MIGLGLSCRSAVMAKKVLKTLLISGLLACGLFDPAIATPSHREESLVAIVQLRDLKLTPPQVLGQATLPLQLLPDSRAFTLSLQTGNQSGQFLVDTGASTSIMATELLQRLKLTGKPIPANQLSLAVAGDRCPPIQARWYRMPSLFPVAGTGQGGNPAASLPSPLKINGLQAIEFSRKILPGGILGVLGTDVLGQFDVKINPSNPSLQLLPQSRLPEANQNQAIPLQRRLGVMIAQLKINGVGPFKFMLDTGADSVFISPRLAEQIQADPLMRRPIEVLGFCGLEKAEKLMLSQVEMASSQQTYQQSNLEGIILTSPILKLLEVDGILGQSFLAQYQQHWRFTPSQINGQNVDGSLILNPDVTP
jgi:predicted aspartyl protease